MRKRNILFGVAGYFALMIAMAAFMNNCRPQGKSADEMVTAAPPESLAKWQEIEAKETLRKRAFLRKLPVVLRLRP